MYIYGLLWRLGGWYCRLHTDIFAYIFFFSSLSMCFCDVFVRSGLRQRATHTHTHTLLTHCRTAWPFAKCSLPNPFLFIFFLTYIEQYNVYYAITF